MAIDLDKFRNATCTVIIATMATKSRRNSLLSAIESIAQGNHCEHKIVVVVNGKKFDVELVNELESRSDIEVIRLPEASLSAALLAGRKATSSEFFGFLDDDDEYLPGALDQRLSILLEYPDAALVASNGYRVSGENSELVLGDFQDVEIDALQSLFRENWLASCGGLYRNSMVPVELFDNIPRYLEWTWIAFRIASAGLEVRALAEPTYRINETPGSESKSEAYLLSHPDILKRMLEVAQRDEIRDLLARQLSAAWHTVSEHYRVTGHRAKAWRSHLRSLLLPGGSRYLAYTRHLLFK